MPYSIALFDADNTLLDFTRAEHDALCACLAARGLDSSEETVSVYSAINDGHWKRLERGETTRDRLKVERFADYFATVGYNGDPVRMARDYESTLGRQTHLLEGALELIQGLYGKCRLYIVTNGIKHTQENRIEKSGLIRYADGVFISEAVGAGKPSKEYFDYVFDFTGADRKSSVIMGDSLTSDIKGGINAGIRTIWFNSKGLPPSDDIVPTCEIHGWDEVYKIL